MSRTVRLSLHVVMIVGLAGALTSCGGASSKSSKPSGATTSSRASVSSTTRPAPAATEPATDPITAKAALRLTDLGAGFVNYRKARGVTAVGAKSCSVIAPGAFLTTQDHVYTGPMFKKQGAAFFAYSEAYAFRTEAIAKRFAAFRATAAFKQCKQKQDDAAARKAQADTYVKLTAASWSDPSGHIPSMYREIAGSISGGKQVDGGFYDRYTVRHGRVVVVVDLDSALARDTAGSQALATETGDILRSFDAALGARLAGA